MGNLYIPGKGEVKGPWLLTVDELESLDKILDLIEEKIDESAEKQILSEAQEKFDKGEYLHLYPTIEARIQATRELYASLSSKKHRNIKLTSTDEKVLTDSSLKSIIRDSRLKDFTPKDLSVEIQNANNIFNLEVTRRFDGNISYSVKCIDQPTEDAIIYEISTWLEKHKPSKPRQIWNEFWFAFAILGFIFGFSLLPYIITYQGYDYKPVYKRELNQILAKGITDDNKNKAVELYIKYSTDYLPANLDGKSTRNIDKPLLRAVIVLLFISITSMFRPKTTIGLGGHKWLVSWYNTYTRIIFVIIPSSIMLPPLYSFIRQLLGF